MKFLCEFIEAALLLRAKCRVSVATSATSCNYSSKVLKLDSIVKKIENKNISKIVVMTGAGLSTASGVPDFRSPGTGLYDNLSSFKIPYPEAVFEISYFKKNPKPFYTIAKQLSSLEGRHKPNYAHFFIKLLHDKGLLLRLYTQNIDGLERLAGIPADKLIEAHGSFNAATCLNCFYHYGGEVVKGIIKPDVVFFGENLPDRFYLYLDDMRITDLLLIIGTSLEVYPFAGIIEEVGELTPRILFNREPVGPFISPIKRLDDIAVTGDLITGLKNFVEELGWENDMNELISRNIS